LWMLFVSVGMTGINQCTWELEMPRNLTAYRWKKLDSSLYKFDSSPKILHDITNSK
jgi:hypothetical protein